VGFTMPAARPSVLVESRHRGIDQDNTPDVAIAVYGSRCCRSSNGYTPSKLRPTGARPAARHYIQLSMLRFQ
jgi:hypothetical protein